MTPDRQERVRSWVNHLVNLSPEERLENLEQIGTDDPSMRRDIEARLSSSDPNKSLDAPSVMLEQRRDRVGQTVYHYRIDEKLGGGGMGIVYKAQDLRLDRAVALKFLPPTMDDDDERLKRLIVEARAASALDHPNICTIHQIEQTHDGHWFIVMAYYDGDTLKRRIERSPMPVLEVLDIGMQVAQGLCKAHKEGIVHRDLKPANLMITTEQVVKIVDFGLAQLHAQTKLTAPGTRLGTPAYMSPEQAQGQPLDHRTDIWSMGVVLYEMLAARPPFKGEYELAVIYSIVNEEPAPITQFREDTPPELASLIEKCLSKDPADRYEQMADLLDELQSLKFDLRPGADSKRKSSPTVVLPPPAPLRSRKRMVAVGFAAVVALGAAALMLLQSPPRTSPPSSGSVAAPQSTAMPPTSSSQTPGDTASAPDSGSAADTAATSTGTTEIAVTPEPPASPTVSPSERRSAAPKPPPAPTPAPVASARVTRTPTQTSPPPAKPAAPPAVVTSAPATPPVVEPPVEEPPALVNLAAQELDEWTRVRDSRDVAVLESFLRQYPNGSLRREALARIEDLKWEAARSATNPGVIESYLRDNPNTRYISQARARLEELRPPPPVPAPVRPAPEVPKQEAPKPEVKAEPPQPPPDVDLIRDVLKKFGAAYRSRDVDQVAAVWPTLTADQLHRLANSFRVAVSIQQDLTPLSDPVIRGDDATVRCRRSSRYEDERGPQRPVDEDVDVTLRKRQGVWSIHSVR